MALFLSSLPFALCSCGLVPTSCNAVGCSDGVSVQAMTESGGLADGTYTVSIQADGNAMVRCTLDATTLSSAPPIGQLIRARCDDAGVEVTLGARVVCTEHRSEDAVSQRCTPLEGQWELRIDVPGTPTSLRVQIARDRDVLADETLSPRYEVSQPNGPDCDPTCRQAAPAPLVLTEP